MRKERKWIPLLYTDIVLICMYHIQLLYFVQLGNAVCTSGPCFCRCKHDSALLLFVCLCGRPGTRFACVACSSVVRFCLSPNSRDIGTAHQDDFVSFGHPSFPQHGLRIKKVHGFCDPTVNVYSGFLDFTSGDSKVAAAYG